MTAIENILDMVMRSQPDLVACTQKVFALPMSEDLRPHLLVLQTNNKKMRELSQKAQKFSRADFENTEVVDDSTDTLEDLYDAVFKLKMVIDEQIALARQVLAAHS